METQYSSFLLIRPPLNANLEGIRIPDPQENTIYTDEGKFFTLPKIFPDSSTNEEIFNTVSPLLQGYDSGISTTIIVHGSASTGKSFILNGSDTNPGVLNRSVIQIFRDLGDNYSIKLSIIFVSKYEVRDMQSDQDLTPYFKSASDSEIFLEGHKKLDVLNASQVIQFVKIADRKLRKNKLPGFPYREYSLICDLYIEEKGYDYNGYSRCSRIRFVYMNQSIGPVNLFGGLSSRDRLEKTCIQSKDLNEAIYAVTVKKEFQPRNSYFLSLLYKSLLNSKVIILNCISNIKSNDSIRVIRFTFQASCAYNSIQPCEKKKC